MRGKILIPFLILCVTLTGCATIRSEPSVDQIKADLIGHNLTISGVQVWSFDALSEYEQFNITGNQTQGNAIEYDVSMRLVDLASNTHFLADAAIVYRYSNEKWELVSVVAKTFQQIISGGTFKTICIFSNGYRRA